MQTTLHWIERILLAVGLVIAAWCAIVLLQGLYYAHLPVPSATTSGAVERLPGDPGSGNKTVAHPRIAPGTWVAKLEAPSVDLAATILEGSDDATLMKAAGHIENTAMPGEAGNIAIAGHRDTTFRAVRKLKVGDPLILVTPSGTFTYRIAWTKIVDPDDVYVLDPTTTPSLTLVTCYPFTYIGSAPQRFIVRASMATPIQSVSLR